MSSNVELPPSPPASTSNKSSPTTLPTSPTLTPPPDVVRTPSLSPTPGGSPLPPLPHEVFLLAMQYIPPREVPTLCLVSRAWASFLNSEPQLWPELDIYLDRDQQRSIEMWTKKVSVNKGRYIEGGIRNLHISLESHPKTRYQHSQHFLYPDKVDTAIVRSRLEHLLGSLDYACVPFDQSDHFGKALPRRRSSLKTMSLSLHPTSMAPIWVLHMLAQAAHSPLFEDLKQIDISARIPELRFFCQPLFIWPSLLHFNVTMTTCQDEVDFNDTNWSLSAPRESTATIPSQTPLPLRSISWRTLTIARGTVFPPLPHLTTLDFRNITWEGTSFFFLLRTARKTLEEIHIYEFRLEEDDNEEDCYLDWKQNVHVQDPHLIDDHLFPDEDSFDDEDYAMEPAPIIFPRLRSLVLSGDCTPVLFAPVDPFEGEIGAMSHPTPVFVMPALQSATIEECLSEDPDFDDAFGTLQVLGRNAVDLLELSLSTTCASDQAVFQCLAGMSGRLQRLTLYDSNITDVILTKLPALAPLLEFLDVRKCTEISCQGVARLVEVIRDQSSGKHRIGAVLVDPPESDWYVADWTAWAWMDWVGALGRHEWDPQGLGPRDLKKRKLWKAYGKQDIQLDFKKKLREKEEQERRLAILQAQAQTQQHYRPPMQQTVGGSHGPVFPSVLQLPSIPSQPLPYGQAHIYQPRAQPHYQEAAYARAALSVALGSGSYPIGPLAAQGQFVTTSPSQTPTPATQDPRLALMKSANPAAPET